MKNVIPISQDEELRTYWSEDNILPETTSVKSRKLALWKCGAGHKWEMTISHFRTVLSCPYCSGRRAIPGETDLGTVHPELRKEWNDSRSYTEFLPNSTYEASWKCKEGHLFTSKICRRTVRGDSCPYCSGKRVMKGFNNLFFTHPGLEEIWDSDRNTVDPDNVSYGSHKKVWWRCDKGHSWLNKIQNVAISGARCHYCSGHKVLRGFNDITTTNPELLQFWDTEKNKEYSPYEVSKGSAKKVWWICKEGHSFKRPIHKMLVNECPYCTNFPKTIATGINDLKTKNPEVLRLWDYEKNTLDPTTIAPHSEEIAFWKCDFGHSWEKDIKKITTGERCPYCAGKRVLIGFNDLESKCPKSVENWSKNNELPPNRYVEGSEKIVEYFCPDTAKFFDTPVIRISASYPFCCCPNCTRARSKGEREVAKYIADLGYEIEVNNRDILHPQELDIVIKSLNIAIEYNGDYWHSDDVIRQCKDLSAFEYHEQKFKGAEKKGYKLFFVWENDWEKNQNFVKESIKQFLESSHKGTPPILQKYEPDNTEHRTGRERVQVLG